MSYKEAMIATIAEGRKDNPRGQAVRRQMLRETGMSAAEAMIVDEAMLDLVAEVAGVIGAKVDSLAEQLQVQAALLFMRGVNVNMDLLEDIFVNETVRVATERGLGIITEGCNCLSCQANRAAGLRAGTIH